MAQNDKSAVSVHSPKPFDTLIRRMADLAVLDDGTAFSTDRLDKMLTAETLDEIWQSGEQDSNNSRTLAGVEMEIDNFEVKFSRGAVSGTGEKITTPFVTEQGKQMYLIVHATRISMSEKRPDIALGAEIEFNTSAPDLVGKLWRLRETGNLPVECFIESIDLGGGQAVNKLRPVPKRATRA
jgi:hypothetical protein